MLNSMKHIEDEPDLIASVHKYMLATNYHIPPHYVDEMSKVEVDTLLFIADTMNKSRRLHSNG